MIWRKKRSWPFSKERFFLYLTYIIYSFIVIYAITYKCPNYLNDTIFILLAVLCFSYGAYLICQLTGINKKVELIEEKIFEREIKERYADFFSDLKKNSGDSPSSTEKEKREWKDFEKSQWSWKGKAKHELTAAEDYFKTENSIRRLNSYDKIINLVAMHVYGFFILVNPLYAFLATILIGMITLGFFFIHRNLRKKFHKLYIEV